MGARQSRKEKAFRCANQLTANRLDHYSNGMISDFTLLTQKVGELVEVAHALRRDNATLRAQASILAAENAELARRMQSAQQRIAALLVHLPDPHALSSTAPDTVQQDA